MNRKNEENNLCQPCLECKAKLDEHESLKLSQSQVMEFYAKEKTKLKAADELLTSLRVEHAENNPCHVFWYEDCDVCRLIAKAEAGDV